MTHPPCRRVTSRHYGLVVSVTTLCLAWSSCSSSSSLLFATAWTTPLPPTMWRIQPWQPHGSARASPPTTTCVWLDRSDETTAAVSTTSVSNQDDDDDGNSINSTDDSTTPTLPSNNSNNSNKSSWWDNVRPQLKERLQQEGQERAIRNKKKREPLQDKKRRRLVYVRDAQMKKKRSARVIRPLPLDGNRTPLANLVVGMECPGVVISLTHFGAYIDIGSARDGLLHVSQFTVDEFVDHPRVKVQPGDDVTVRVRSVNVERNKLHLTMLPRDVVETQLAREGRYDNTNHSDDDDDPRIPLSDLQIDDELWGEVARVTNFGAYVQVGAVVDGFLHFMDHPGWTEAAHPTEFMARGDRIRVWVSRLEGGTNGPQQQQERIQLTALRPTHLPGPRREFLAP